MTGSLSIIIVTRDQEAAAQVAVLSKGTDVQICEILGLHEASLERIVQARPSVVIVGGLGHDTEYLSFATTLIRSAPEARCVLLSDSADVAAIARAVAAGIHGYFTVDSSCRTFLRAITAAAKGEMPKEEDAFTRVAKAIEIPGGRPKANELPRSVTLAIRKTVSQCMGIGLTVSETASYVGLSEEQVTGCLSVMSLVRLLAEAFAPRRLAVAMAALLGLFCIYRAAGVMASSEPYTVPVQGQVLYEDGAALPVGPCEITFYPRHVSSRIKKYIGRAITDPGTGEFKRVCSNAKFAGLVPGEYRVTIRLPGQTPLPAYVLAEEYRDEVKTPLAIDAGTQRFLVRVPRPKAMMDRFDRNKDGAFSEPERRAVVAAVRGEAIRQIAGN